MALKPRRQKLRGLVALAALPLLPACPSQPSPAPSQTPVPQVATAKFKDFKGTVKVKANAGLQYEAAELAKPLYRGDMVQTASNSSAEIEFLGSSTTVSVRPDSLIRIEGTSEDASTRQRRTAFGLKQGEVNYEKASAEGATEISTDEAKVTHGGRAQGSARVSEGGTDLRVFKADEAAQLESKGGDKVAVGSREQVRVDAAGKAGAKVALPDAPDPLAPKPDADLPPPVRLTWRPVKTAASYHVMVDYTQEFNRPVLERKGVRETQVELKTLEPGQYYWRVSAGNPDGAEGAFSPAGRFSIVKASAPPVLSVEPLAVRGNTVLVKGKTDAGATVTVNDREIDVGRDGSFAETIILEGKGAQQVVIRSRSAQGGVAEVRKEVVVN